MTDDLYLGNVAERYDAFLQECLKPYGITKENVLDYADRVRVDRYHPVTRKDDIGMEILFYDEFFLDGQYIFSVKQIAGHEEIAPGTYRASVRYEKYVKGVTDA